MSSVSRLVFSLRRDAKLQKDEGTQIGCDFDEIDSSIVGDERAGVTAVALGFWDSWIDCSNHNWMYYEGIDKPEWILLATEIANSLEHGNELPNNVVAKLKQAGIPV